MGRELGFQNLERKKLGMETPFWNLIKKKNAFLKNNPEDQEGRTKPRS